MEFFPPDSGIVKGQRYFGKDPRGEGSDESEQWQRLAVAGLQRAVVLVLHREGRGIDGDKYYSNLLAFFRFKQLIGETMKISLLLFRLHGRLD